MPVVGHHRYPTEHFSMLRIPVRSIVDTVREKKFGDASSHQSKSRLETAIDWINNNQQIDDIVLSGDPFRYLTIG